MLSNSNGVAVQAGQAERTVQPVAGNVAPATVAEAPVEEPDDFEFDEDIDADVPPEEEAAVEEAIHLPRLIGWGGKTKGRRLVKPAEGRTRGSTSPEQKLLLLDTWMRSGLSMGEFAGMVGIAKHTLYLWKKRFDAEGPAGLLDRGNRGKKGSRLPEITKRTILMLKKANPSWGCQRISDMLVRGPALPASPEAVARVLHEDGYETVEDPTRPHPDKVRSFERAKPNQLWQTDLFTFTLKRQNRRVNLIAFLDDHSRFIVSYGLYGSSSTVLVLEVLNAGIASYGPPEEILTDNGPQ